VAPLRVAWRQRLARLCTWLAVVAVVVAAAQPSIQAAPRQRVGILELVVDRSGSTAAGDLAPTRLGAVQQATLALLHRVPERTRVGLVAFSDKAATVHCIRDPDDRETPAIDAERRLARKLGGSRLLEFVASRYRELDSSGHWTS
jgi:Ca-activated chloride channel family protein